MSKTWVAIGEYPVPIGQRIAVLYGGAIPMIVETRAVPAHEVVISGRIFTLYFRLYDDYGYEMSLGDVKYFMPMSWFPIPITRE